MTAHAPLPCRPFGASRETPRRRNTCRPRWGLRSRSPARSYQRQTSTAHGSSIPHSRDRGTRGTPLHLLAPRPRPSPPGSRAVVPAVKPSPPISSRPADAGDRDHVERVWVRCPESTGSRPARVWRVQLCTGAVGGLCLGAAPWQGMSAARKRPKGSGGTGPNPAHDPERELEIAGEDQWSWAFVSRVHCRAKGRPAHWSSPSPQTAGLSRGTSGTR